MYRLIHLQAVLENCIKTHLLLLHCLILVHCCCREEDTSHATTPGHTCVKPVYPKAAPLNDPTVAKAALPKGHDFST
jgi:hypothetical protein